MWQLINNTEFPAESLFYTDKSGNMKWVIICKVNWSMKSKQVQIAESHQVINFIDEYQDNDTNKALAYGSDLTPVKDFTDIIIKGFGYYPSDVRHDYSVIMQFGELIKNLRVRQLRQCTKGIFGIDITEKGHAKKVSLGYENAFGGKYMLEGREYFFASNPSGKGYTCKKHLSKQIVDLPVLEYHDSTWHTSKLHILPAAFGYIPPAWEPRRAYAGTYSEQWFAEKFPLYPDDFNTKFWQQAAYDQQYQGKLRGGEMIRLINMTKTGEQINILPKNKELYPVEIVSSYRGSTKLLDYVINTILLEPEELSLSTVFATEIQYDPDEDEDISITINHSQKIEE